jgi:FKBP-type peptidyl-prolyl cis-trans isomerase SlyD
MRRMKIAKDVAVSIEYTLTGPDGKVIDTSEGHEPLVYLHGAGNIIPGLERELEGKGVGDALTVSVAAADGYGEHRANLVQEVQRQSFQGVEKVEEGMQFQANTPQGPRVVRVTKVAGDRVTIDANHPLAGIPLKFDVKVVDVRAATQEELDHGHAHGPGGHHHH